MRRSVMSVIFAAALLFECYALSAALPAANVEDESLERDAFSSLLTSEVIESGVGDAEAAGDAAAAARARAPRVIVVATDPSLWRNLRALQGGLTIYKRMADDGTQAAEHRSMGQQLSIPILRRDTMRCMVGRVYRPCWEV